MGTMGMRMTGSERNDRVRSVSSQPLSAAVSRRSSLESVAPQRATLRHDRGPAVGRHAYGDAASRAFASEPLSGYATGRIVSDQALGGVTSPRLSGGGISRMVTNGTLSRPATGPGVSQVYAELGPWLYVLVLLILIALLAFFYLSQTSHVATQVSQMQSLEEKVEQLKRDNNAIRVEISAYEDMSRIQREATAMGLAEPLEREYVVAWLDEPSTAPDNPVVPNDMSRTTGPTNLAVVSRPSLWSGILQQFQTWVQGGWAPTQSLSR